MSKSKLDWAFDLGVKAARRRSLECGTVLHGKFRKETNDDWDLIEKMFEAYMNGIECAVAEKFPPPPEEVRHEAC